ncbi:MAG: cyclic nucleotide-binding domain-containing protein [Chloroflexota bacterium]
MTVIETLKKVELFEGLDKAELQKVAKLCKERRLKRGEAIAVQGEPGNEMFIITEGFVEVVRHVTGDEEAQVVVNLGSGQIVGEMALVDHGPRSATVKAVSDPTVVQAIKRDDFDGLCEQNNHIGYIVMHNMAADLSFRIRHRYLTGK